MELQYALFLLLYLEDEEVIHPRPSPVDILIKSLYIWISSMWCSVGAMNWFTIIAMHLVNVTGECEWVTGTAGMRHFKGTAYSPAQHLVWERGGGWDAKLFVDRFIHLCFALLWFAGIMSLSTVYPKFFLLIKPLKLYSLNPAHHLLFVARLTIAPTSSPLGGF